MSTSELTENNYKRICFINWALSVPLLLIFSWPYFFLSEIIDIGRFISYFGAITFALPFMFTILHGHVTMALGVVHRNHYYDWLASYPFTYGVLFHPIIISTRFRITLFGVSLILLLLGYIFR